MICIDMWGSRGTAFIAGCVVLALPALGLPEPAWSASHRPPRQRQVNAQVLGSLTIAWSGDPARGCAAAGLCGVSGTLQMHFGNSEVSSSGGPPELMANDESAVARVQTTAPDGSVTACADLVPVQFDLAVHRTGDQLAARVPASGAAQTPSSGRCAGPTSGDLTALRLPARRTAHGYDFSGRTSFIAGPFAVTAVSGARARITFGGNGGGGGITSGGTTSTPVKLRSVLVERAGFTYRVTGFAGTLTTAFAGLAPPQCDPLGACGVAGRLVQSFATRGTLRFAGARITAHHVGRDRALADLRQGTMELSDTFAERVVHETVTEMSSQTGNLPCSAHSSTVLPATGLRPRRGRDELLLSGALPGFGGGGSDPFRTPCPGPATADILGPNGGRIATATVTAGQLGDRRLSITFRGHGSFDGSAYTGRRSGAVVLGLVLVRSTGGTRRETLFPGEPVI
jgi:hypothetical protein